MNGNLIQDTIDVLGKLEFYSDGGVRRYPYEKEVDAIVARLQNALSDLEPADEVAPVEQWEPDTLEEAADLLIERLPGIGTSYRIGWCSRTGVRCAIFNEPFLIFEAGDLMDGTLFFEGEDFSTFTTKRWMLQVMSVPSSKRAQVFVLQLASEKRVCAPLI